MRTEVFALGLAVGLAIGLGLGSWWIALGFVALWALAPALGRGVPEAAWGPVAIGVLGLGAVAVFFDAPVEPTLLLALGGLGVQRRAAAPSDGRGLLVVVALMLVVAATRTSSIGLGVALVALAVGAPAALGAGRSVLVGAVVLAAIPPFLLVPRLTPGTAVADPSRGLTGFDDDLELGELQQLLDDPAPVFAARFSTPPAETVYFRGIALDRFDGRRWWTESRRRPEPDWAGLPDSVRVDVELEAHPEGVLFVAGVVDGLDARGVRVERDAAGSYHLPGPSRTVNYTVFAQPGGGFGVGRADPYADAPPSVELPAMSDEARALFTGRVDLTSAPAVRMDALAAWLRQDFEYTRQPRDADPEAPLERFLRADRRGHCEYFASALAVGGRVVGVPTRVVNGFVGGEAGPDGRIVVRRYHAHSWVEYFDGQRWITADATPTVGAPTGPGAWVKAGEALEDLWESAVVGYDAEAQLAPARAVARGVEPWTGTTAQPWIGVVVVGGLLGLVIVVGRSLERRWVRALDGDARPDEDPVTRQLRAAQALVRANGFDLPDSLPDVEGARRVASVDRALGGALEELAWVSYAVRFDGADAAVHTERARALRGLVTRLLEGGA